jgi:hypothetical protein
MIILPSDLRNWKWKYCGIHGVNTGSTPVTATISVTPSANGCPGTPQTFTITVNPTPTVA